SPVMTRIGGNFCPNGNACPVAMWPVSSRRSAASSFCPTGRSCSAAFVPSAARSGAVAELVEQREYSLQLLRSHRADVWSMGSFREGGAHLLVRDRVAHTGRCSNGIGGMSQGNTHTRRGASVVVPERSPFPRPDAYRPPRACDSLRPTPKYRDGAA